MRQSDGQLSNPSDRQPQIPSSNQLIGPTISNSSRTGSAPLWSRHVQTHTDTLPYPATLAPSTQPSSLRETNRSFSPLSAKNGVKFHTSMAPRLSSWLCKRDDELMKSLTLVWMVPAVQKDLSSCIIFPRGSGQRQWPDASCHGGVRPATRQAVPSAPLIGGRQLRRRPVPGRPVGGARPARPPSFGSARRGVAV